MYLRGQGVTADAKKALEYHELAAKSGNPVALYNLGALYYIGGLVNQDYKMAGDLFENSAKQGLAEAQHDYIGRSST